MNSKNPPAAYRATAARLATMTIAQRAAELERAIAAVRAAAPSSHGRWPSDAALWAMLVAHDRADDVAGAAAYARDLEVVLCQLAAS